MILVTSEFIVSLTIGELRKSRRKCNRQKGVVAVEKKRRRGVSTLKFPCIEKKYKKLATAIDFFVCVFVSNDAFFSVQEL